MSAAGAGTRLARVRHESGQVAVGAVAGDELGLLATADPLAVLQGAEPEVVGTIAIGDGETCAVSAPWTLLAPITAPETWAAGVTYEHSRDARMRESEVVDVYDLVYDAERPELFLKDCAGRRTVGPGEPIATRRDSSWTVPEPELAVVLGPRGSPLAVTIGNDVSSRDIEGANPLYLPQAKIYAQACALGPVMVVPQDWDAPFEIELRILGPQGGPVFEAETSTANMRRSLSELIDFLCRDNPVPAGSVLLTGTGIVPPDDVTLLPGQSVEIRIGGIGRLKNPVAGAAGFNQ
ncbi:MAG TPA: fumarylacetoacetate hydrolase family protein [Solirubrobacteraceae bacterium]|jgi:2-dehydro-3-deoxy-D-arabinonate dehydratase